MYRKYLPTLLLFLFFTTSMVASDSIVWKVDNLEMIGGLPVTVVGDPQVITLDDEVAVEFDGVNDGLFINSNPVAGDDAFTVEIIFKPYSGGGAEQRFLHIQQDDNNRMLIELRSTASDQWYIDTFIKSGSSNRTLVEEGNVHPNNQWHTAALVYENNTMRHYIDGELELTGAVNYVKQMSGITSLGVRQNKVSWYKGAIKLVRVSHRALTADELLKGSGNGTGNSDLKFFSGNGFIVNSISDGDMEILNCEVKEAGNISVVVYTLSGQKINLIDRKTVERGMNEIPLDFSNFSKGIYLARISLNGSVKTVKIQIR